MITDILIIGKGPSTDNIQKLHDLNLFKNNIVVVLNTAIKLYNGIVDYHFMNDFENLNKLNTLDLLKSKNIVIPSFPHYKENANINMDHNEFIKKLPSNYNGKIHIYELYTAPIKNKFEFLNVTWSVAETAVLWFIKRGYTNFNFIGIGTDTGYSKLLNNEKPATHQNKEWLTKNYNLIIKHLDENKCTYKFY